MEINTVSIRVIVDNVKNSVSQLKTMASELARNKMEALKNNEAFKKMKGSVEKSTTTVSKFVRALGRVAFYRAVRKVLSSLTQAFKEGLENAYHYSEAMKGLDSTNVKGNLDRVATSVQYLKNAIGASLTPVIQVLTPIVERLADSLAKLFNAMSKVFGALVGNSSYTFAKKFGTTWKKGIDGATASAKELKRTLLGFDEINRLNDNNDSGGGASSDVADYSKMFDEAKIDDSWASKIRSVLESIALIGGVAMAGLGLVLLFTGHPIGGLELIVAGLGIVAGTLAINGGTIPDDVQSTLEDIQAVATELMLAIGVVLLCTGHLALGLGVIVSTIAFQSTQIDWGSINPKVKSTLTTIATVGAVGLLAIGIILCCIGNVPLGVAMIIGGGALGVSAGVINWDYLKGKISSTWDKIKSWFNTNVKPIFTSKWWSDKWNTITSTAQTKLDTLKSNIVSKLTTIKTNISNKLNEWKSLFSNWSAKIKTPHLTWTTNPIPSSDWKYKILNTLGLPTSLPKLNVSWYAKGGIVNGATLIGAGERGAEAIIPLENNTEWLDKVADRLLVGMGNQSIVLNVDGKKLFDVMVERNNSQVRRTGVSPLKV